MISFLFNDRKVKTSLQSGSTVLDFIREEKHLMGTKTGCREGDCGACSVLVGELKNGKLIYRSMTSCLMPLGNAHGKHILTVEGINLPETLSLVQQSMVDQNGSQCGFCTIGFIMSFTGFVLDPNGKTTEAAIKAIDGNICRCTGYKSIERAADNIASKMEKKPKSNTLKWLVKQGYLPTYFENIEAELQQLQDQTTRLPFKGNGTTKYLGGGTDLIVQKPEQVKYWDNKHILYSQELKGISLIENECIIGASTTVTDLEESSIFTDMFPDSAQYLKLVSSTPIRNMATLAGNFVNASPIGDMTIFFLALNSSITLKEGNKRRTIKLKDFYKGYKTLDKSPKEHIESISFKAVKAKHFFNFEKVSKRTHLDIASVNSACLLKLNKDQTIKSIHLSAGGVGPTPKHLSKTCKYLKGKTLDSETFTQALQTINQEISPISDARGSADYKRLLLKQLVIAHFLKFFGPQTFITENLVTETTEAV